MTKPLILQSTCDPLADQPFEIVERKGLGHPNTICDAVMEQVAVELAQAYLKRCGRVLHFNADKVTLARGDTVGCAPADSARSPAGPLPTHQAFLPGVGGGGYAMC